MRTWLLRILVGLAVVAVIAGLVFRQQVGDVYGYLFPGGIVDDATDRTSDPATTTSGSPVPSTVPAPRTSADAAPELAVRALVELDSPSALVDLDGPGPVLVSTLAGLVHLVDLEQGSDEVVLDLRDEVSTGGERGLLGMAADRPASEPVELAGDLGPVISFAGLEDGELLVLRAGGISSLVLS